MTGTYAIKATTGTLAAANYTFAFVSGMLTVTNLNPTVTPPAAAIQTASAGASKAYTLGTFSDPGASDNPWRLVEDSTPKLLSDGQA